MQEGSNARGKQCKSEAMQEGSVQEGGKREVMQEGNNARGKQCKRECKGEAMQ